MKKVMKLAYLLMGVALLLSSCSEDIFPGGSESNEDVTISLAYSDVSPRDIVVNSRATPEDERHLDNLYIYIFDGNGKLKGYKGIEVADNLNQETSSSNTEVIKNIKTRSGNSYIYAVANISTGLYPVATSNGTVEPNKLPINLDEEKARAGEYEFTLDQLKALTFNRSNRNTIQISSAFLMSGAVQQGDLVNITPAGTIENGENGGNDIRLSRIVSKVKFTIKEYTRDGVTRSFKLDNYSIMNIAMKGTLIGNIDGNKKYNISNNTDVSNIVGQTLGVNDVDETGAEYFEAYLPENLQDAKQDVTVQEMRENDNKTNPKVFTNAPEYGTYVVLKGKYEETTKDGSTKTADVTYYVHLGDCSVKYNDYNVERNCSYTFNITVAGVDKIIVEAQKEGNEQPGAEGVVLQYGNTGKNLTLDSHYEYMVMRFNKEDIQKLKASNLGYYYQVYALGKKTEPINVKNEANPKTEEHQKQLNGVDTSWIEFAITGRKSKITGKKSKSSYGSENDGRGTPCDYPGKGNTKDIETFLKLLYDKADDNSFWTNGEYIDATCFVSENYYSDLTWDRYVNNVDKRAFYVANNVWVSEDTRSVYAEAQYGLTQHNIQTFYDRSQAESVIAYGCETINDEEKSDGDSDFNLNDQVEGSNGNNYWDGRANMKQDIFRNGKPVKTWDDLKNKEDKLYYSLRIACMRRTRDLNGDGKINEEEMRWYAPATQQYAGLWIGEQILSKESKLFKKSTTELDYNNDSKNRMVYYSSTKDAESFLSEEGMATGNYNSSTSPYRPKYVRCIRNLQSGNIGFDQKPNKYYSFDSSTKTVTLNKVDQDALNITGEQGELNDHTEREEGNKPAQKFTIAADKWDTGYYINNTLINPSAVNVYTGKYQCYGRYWDREKRDTKWRVPNQRELCIMTMVAPDDVRNTACRTQFSNMNFRKSWTYNSSNIVTMSLSGVSGVRCIKVLK